MQSGVYYIHRFISHDHRRHTTSCYNHRSHATKPQLSSLTIHTYHMTLNNGLSYILLYSSLCFTSSSPQCNSLVNFLSVFFSFADLSLIWMSLIGSNLDYVTNLGATPPPFFLQLTTHPLIHNTCGYIFKFISNPTTATCINIWPLVKYFKVRPFHWLIYSSRFTFCSSLFTVILLLFYNIAFFYLC